ncbi:MAG: TonB-dependent receptor [Candidatus Kapabacteria bacterium]|nr:TonB-dependent receptor [Candidatus Kapabacteria bacterium]
MLFLVLITISFATIYASPTLPAQQDTTQTTNHSFKTKPTRKQILAMKFEDLSALSLQELTELSAIVGVQSVDELLKLLVNTASKTNERLNDAPGIVSVITAREIELFGAQTLEDVLNYMVSVNLGTNFLYPENLHLRGETSQGLTNNHVLFLLNGRPMRETLIGGIYTEILTGFPIHAIERIELVRGPGSVLYGTGAFTGTVNIITKSTFNTILTARAGSFGTITASAQSGVNLPTTLGDLKLSAAAYYHNRNDWSVPYRARAAGNVPLTTNTYTPSRQALSGLVTAEIGGFHAQASITNYSATVLGITPVFPTIEHTILSVSADAGYKHQFTDAFSSSLNFTAKHYQSAYESRTNAQDFILELTNYYEPNQNFKFLLGGFLNARQGTIVNAANSAIILIAPYNQLWFTGYAEAQWQPLEALRLSAGVQVNKPELTDFDIVPRLNVIVNFTPEIGLKALYGQAYRAPSAFEMFLDGPVSVGNRNLRPEKVATIDAELFWETSQTRLSLAYFNGLQTDVITPTGRVGNRNTPVNQGQYQMEGIEFEGKVAPSNDLYLLGSVLLQRNLLNSTIATSAPTPNLTVKFGAGYDNHDGLSASIFYIYTGEYGLRNTNNFTPNPIPRPYHFLTANINADIVELLNLSGLPHIILNLRIENALNEEKWYPNPGANTNALPLSPGRGIYGGIIVKF